MAVTPDHKPLADQTNVPTLSGMPVSTLVAPSVAVKPATVVDAVPVLNAPGLLPASLLPALSMGSADIATYVAVPPHPASIPVDPKTLPGSDGDVNGLASMPFVGTTVAFIHEDLGFAPNRESVHHPNYKGSRFNVMVEWEGGEVTSEPLKSNGDYYDALTVPTVRPGFPNVISPFPSSTNSDSDFEDSPDLVLTESNELSTASAEGFITFADICASLFGDDDTTVGAAYCTIDGDGDDGRSYETVSSLFTEVRTELAVFSREISTVVDEFELDCLAAQAELAGLLGPPQVAPGEPNGAPGAVVADTDSGAAGEMEINKRKRDQQNVSFVITSS